MKTPALPLIALLIVSQASFADDTVTAGTLPKQLNLATALKLAVDHNPDIASAREGIRMQDGVRLEARSAFMPKVAVSAGYSGRSVDRVEGFGSFSPQDQSWTTDLGVSYSLFSGGVNTANLRAAKASVSAAENRLRAAIDDVLLAATERYFDGLLAKGRIGVQEQAIKVLDEQLADSNNRFKAGVGQQFDVLQAEVSLANARPPLVRARSSYKLAVDALRQIIGLDYPEGIDAVDIQLSPEWPEISQRGTMTAAILKARANRPELAALADEIEAGQQRIVAARGNALPKVSIESSYGAQSYQFRDDLTDGLTGWTAGLKVSIPIFTGGYTKARVQQAQAQLRQSEIAADKRRLSIEGEVRQAWYGWDEAREILESSQLVVKQAEEALRLAKVSFQAGSKTQLEVLQSQLELTRSSLEEVEARHAYHTALARLKRAVGGTSAATGSGK